MLRNSSEQLGSCFAKSSRAKMESFLQCLLFFFWLKIFGNSRISCFFRLFFGTIPFFVTFCDSGWLWKIILQPLAFLKRNTLQFKMLAMKVCFLKNCDLLSRETHSGNGWLTGRRWCLGEFGPIELEERGGDLWLPMKFPKLPWFSQQPPVVGGDHFTRTQGKDEADLGRDCFSVLGRSFFETKKTDISPDFKGVEIWFRLERMTFFDGVGPFFFPPDKYIFPESFLSQPRGVLIVPDVMD